VSQTFRALRERNARLFFSGLLVSNVGTWLQATAQVLLVRQLGGTGVQLGTVLALQFLPMLAFGLWAGAMADRHDRRRLTIMFQALMGVQALALGFIDLANLATIPIVYIMSFALGMLGALDNPARRGMVTELVDPADLSNALSLNTAVMTGSRIFGPALAAFLVSAIGTGWCFVLNGTSFLALLAALIAIDPAQLRRTPPAARGGRPVRDGLAAVWADPVLRLTLIVFTVVATFAFNYSVSLPLIVAERLHADDSIFGWLLSAMSVGSVAGSLLTARLRAVGHRWMLGYLAILAVFGIMMALATQVWFAFVVIVPLGLGGAGFITAANVVFQDRTRPDMRSRVLALTAVAFLGSTPIGAPITGFVGDRFGAAWSLLYGSLIAVICLVAATTRIARRRAALPSPSIVDAV
jgi:MFS family permease